MIEKQLPKKLGFEITETDWVIYCLYDPEKKEWGPLIKKGWHDSSYWAPPWSAAINYGVSVFGRLKCHKGPDGKLFLYRVSNHAERLGKSAEGLIIPALPKDKFIEGVKMLVRENKRFVPECGQESFYISVNMYALKQLGIAPDPRTPYIVAFWGTPVGGYLIEGLEAISARIEKKVPRAVPGGIGWIKAAANYAIPRIMSQFAKNEGCKMTLYLDTGGNFIREFDGANAFIVKNNTLFTPPLKDTILDGITRRSLIVLAKKLGISVQEKHITIKETLAADEVFACGTAAVITPVGKIIYRRKEYVIGDGKVGKITKILYDLLTGIQSGRQKDTFDWLTEVEVD